MKHINKAGEINVPPSSSLNPSSGGMNTPQLLTPDRLLDPRLLESESLLSELARVRELALQFEDHDFLRAPHRLHASNVHRARTA